MESLNGKEPLSENEEETLVGEVIREVGEIAYWKAKAEEWRNVALESRLELEEFQNESRYKTHATLPIRTISFLLVSRLALFGLLYEGYILLNKEGRHSTFDYFPFAAFFQQIMLKR